MTTTTALPTITGQDLGSQVKNTAYGVTLVPSGMKPLRNRDHKPKGGLWTSTWTGDERVSGWADWAGNEGMVDPNGALWRLDPKADARIIRVDSLDDLRAVVAVYGLPYEYGTKLDFVAMARDGFDGMNLTDEGQWATRMGEPGLYGWDCESTVWFGWAFQSKEQLSRGLSRWEALEAISA